MRRASLNGAQAPSLYHSDFGYPRSKPIDAEACRDKSIVVQNAAIPKTDDLFELQARPSTQAPKSQHHGALQ